jgi:hypothetical protein
VSAGEHTSEIEIIPRIIVIREGAMAVAEFNKSGTVETE